MKITIWEQKIVTSVIAYKKEMSFDISGKTISVVLYSKQEDTNCKYLVGIEINKNYHHVNDGTGEYETESDFINDTIGTAVGSLFDGYEEVNCIQEEVIKVAKEENLI
jgi:hypothetical protein